MEYFFSSVALYGIPILAIIFCVNLVSVIKKVKADEATTRHTVWMSVSFALILWSIAMMAAAAT